jgi:hypothetical protein
MVFVTAVKKRTITTKILKSYEYCNENTKLSPHWIHRGGFLLVHETMVMSSRQGINGDKPSYLHGRGGVPMVISLRKCLGVIKFIIMFVALTYMFYHMVGLFGRWITPVDQYKIPKGYAVKAFQSNDGNVEDASMGERLRFYYWYGE